MDSNPKEIKRLQAEKIEEYNRKHREEVKAQTKTQRAFEAEKDDEQWVAEDLEAKADKPLVDSGTGDTIAIRTFKFNFHPDIKSGKNELPSKQELFNAHLKQLERMVWAEGMSMLKSHEPQLKFTDDGYIIAVVCGVSNAGRYEDARTLQDIL